jgi:Fe-S-cluster-containing hydrogenase component 2
MWSHLLRDESLGCTRSSRLQRRGGYGSGTGEAEGLKRPRYASREGDKTMSEVEKEPTGEPKGATRRDFLKGAAVGAVGGLVVGGGAGVLVAPAKEVTVEVPKEVLVEVPLEIQPAIGHVAYDPENCAGCRTCMAVCSLYHEGVVQPELSRIQVLAPVFDIFEAQGVTCKQCALPNCLDACPVPGAMYINETTGARVIDAEKCTGCKVCMEACPQHPNTPIRFDAEKNVAIKCDLCDGDPQCVKFCPKSVDLTPNYIPEEARVLRFVKTEAA